MEIALDDNRDPRFGDKVYVEDPNPHRDIFTISWDNDIVNLTKQEAKALIPLLEKFIKQ